MIGNFRLAPDDDIAMLVADPSRVFEFLYGPESGESGVRVVSRDRGVGGFFRRLFGGEEVTVVVADGPAPAQAHAESDDELDVDKAWHGLHFLFTGTAWEGEPPLDFIVSGGVAVGDEDVGYGPARAFTSGEVAAIARALERLSRDDLERRFDPARMMELGIYPEIWDRDPEDDDTLAYLLEYFDLLKDFVLRGARLRRGMLVYIN